MPYGVSPGENGPLIRDVVSRTIALYRRAPRPAEWGGCLAIDPGISAVIGTCSFVNAPDGDGTVEIAYFTFPQFERKGYGTAMASELLRRAIQSGAVRKIIAHTLPRDNASTRIPGKPGLIRAVEAEDPEEGTVWRWEYRVRK